MNFEDKWIVSTHDFKLDSYKEFVLAGDIGGTNARFGIYGIKKGNTELVFLRKFLTKHTDTQEKFKDSMNDLLRYVHEDRGICVSDAAFSLAGPIMHDRSSCKLSNQPLMLEVEYLIEHTELSGFLFLDDIEAANFSLDQISKDEFVKINKVEIDNKGFRAIIYPGTGLGMGFAYFDETKGFYIPLPSEGGHADATCDEKTKRYIISTGRGNPDQETACPPSEGSG